MKLSKSEECFGFKACILEYFMALHSLSLFFLGFKIMNEIELFFIVCFNLIRGRILYSVIKNRA